jgi:hypothetical protein
MAMPMQMQIRMQMAKAMQRQMATALQMQIAMAMPSPVGDGEARRGWRAQEGMARTGGDANGDGNADADADADGDVNANDNANADANADGDGPPIIGGSSRSPRTGLLYFTCAGGACSPGMKVHPADHIIRPFRRLNVLPRRIKMKNK